jgi:beta-glucosidase
MCSYNKINSVWSCENPETLAQDLKSGYGLNFTQGWVMSGPRARFLFFFALLWVRILLITSLLFVRRFSDWGATHSTSINQGLDQEMPDAFYMGDALKAAVQAGTVSIVRASPPFVLYRCSFRPIFNSFPSPFRIEGNR